MTNTKALIGGILGLAIGIALPGSTALFAFRGFAIGFSIGSFLFPPEIEDSGVVEEFNVTGPNPASPVPIIWGHRLTPGSIVFFGFNDWEQKTHNKEQERFYYAPMQIAICISPFARVKILDSQDEPWRMRAYFYSGFPEIGSYHPSSKADLDADTLFSQGASQEEINTKHSRPFLSQGNDPIDTQQAFKVDGLSRGYYNEIEYEDGTKNTTYVPPATFPAWPTKDQIPPLKHVVTLSHPRWYMGEGTNAPSLNFQVYNEIDLSASAWAWTVTYPELGVNEAFTNHLGLNPAHCYWAVFTDRIAFMGFPESILDEDSFLYAEALFETEGYRVNAHISSLGSSFALLEQLNFHSNSVLRSNAAGQIELLPLRRLDDVTNPVIDFDNETFDAPIPGKPNIFVVRDNDIRDIDVSTDTWDVTPNEFQGRFSNVQKGFDDDGHTLKNEAGKDMSGRWVRRSYHFPFFTRRPLVNRRLAQLMRFFSRPKSIASLTLDHRFNSLRKHDGILLYSSEFGFNGLYFRVSEVQYGELGNSKIMLKCLLDTESLSAGIDDINQGEREVGPVETRLSALDAGAHVEYWPSNVAFEDTISGALVPERSPATSVFGTQLYAARRSDYATDTCLQSALGILTATANDGTDDALLLPETSPCSQPLPDWGFRFNLVQDVYRDDHRYSLAASDGGTPIRVRLSSFPGHDLDAESDLDDKADDAAWESDPWVAILTGTPVDQLSDPGLNPPAIIEIWRFKKLVRIESGSDEEGTLYEIQEVLRQANKEHPQGWTAGQELWIARVFRDGDLPAVPNGVEGAIGGLTDNFSFSSAEYDTWIQLYNDPADLRNGAGGFGAPPPITGATNLASSGHTVTDGITVFVEGTDYEVDEETGLLFIYGSGSISHTVPLTITLVLSLSIRWAHRHLSAAAGEALLTMGAQRVRLYTQCRHIENQIILDAEGPLEGIRREFGRFDSNFFSKEDRRRAGISPSTGGLAFKSAQAPAYKLYDHGVEHDRACIIADIQLSLDYTDIDWPQSFFDLGAKDWRLEGSPIYDFSLGFSGEFDGEGRVFSFDTLQNGTKTTTRGFIVRVEDHAYPGGSKKVPMVIINNSAGVHSLYPLGTDGLNPDGSILDWNFPTPNIVIVFYKDGNEFTCSFYIAGAWIGDASTSSGQLESTGGRMDLARAHGEAASTGHYWDVWLCSHKLEDTQVALGAMAAPPNCLFFLPLREPTGSTIAADLGGLKNDFVKQSGTLTADALATGSPDFDDDGYYVQFPPHSERKGLGDAWLDSLTIPVSWSQLENSSSTEGADEADMHSYGDGTAYPEHQGTWYRLDVYVRWTGLEQNPVQGEAYLLRTGRRYGVLNPKLYDPLLELLIDETRPVRDTSWWPSFVYSESMMEVDKARYEAETTATGADWREADLIFVMYKCKSEVSHEVVDMKIKPWNVPTVLPIVGLDQLNYYGLQNQLVHASQVNN